ncbi:hypothetical protein [Clostridium sp. MCC345]|uniref:hypothetical protein n=1 Tax=Clostridium sp. MCC345 TaxID=2592645 RepID=UPI00296FBA07
MEEIRTEQQSGGIAIGKAVLLKQPDLAAERRELLQGKMRSGRWRRKQRSFPGCSKVWRMPICVSVRQMCVMYAGG